jgi:predicted nucleic acid-binding Zn ribbon protein
MRTCINYGRYCVGCGYAYCIDDRKCIGRCFSCINYGCENNTQFTNDPKEVLAWIENSLLEYDI